jgi:hypothetical protein
MSMKRHIVGGVDVGQNPSALSEEHTIFASFHGFENLPHEGGKITTSPTIVCHGHSWAITVYPGGSESATGDTTFVSIFLHLEDDSMSEVTVKYSLRVGSMSSVVDRSCSNQTENAGDSDTF